jgi:N-acetylglucosamine-6-phosphate deacetylase
VTGVLAGARVVTPDRVLDPGWVEVAGGRIAAVGAGRPPAGSTGVRDLGGALLVPGYIDLHMHGGGGHSALASPAEMAAAVAFHRSHGTTRTLVSAVTAPVEAMCAGAAWAADLAARGATPDGHVLGSHLEGPFLSALRCGAQDPDALLAPDLEVLRALLDAGRGTVRMVTVAPELPGALDLVRALVAEGVVAAVGHTDATYEQAALALALGAGVLTHALNGMRGVGHRAPGPVVAAMDHDGAVCELINDGEHVHPPVARLLFRAMPGRVALVTDAIGAAGAGDGEYLLGRLPVVVRGGLARLADGGAIAGSTLTMDAAVRRAVLELGLPVEAAVAAATVVPAGVLGAAADLRARGGSADLRARGGSASFRARGGSASFRARGGSAGLRASASAGLRASGASAFGRIAPGYDADLLVLDDNLDVLDVLA